VSKGAEILNFYSAMVICRPRISTGVYFHRQHFTSISLRRHSEATLYTSNMEAATVAGRLTSLSPMHTDWAESQFRWFWLLSCMSSRRLCVLSFNNRGSLRQTHTSLPSIAFTVFCWIYRVHLLKSDESWQKKNFVYRIELSWWKATCSVG